MKKGNKSGVTRSEASGERFPPKHALLPAPPPPALQLPSFCPPFGVLPHFWSFLQEEKGPGSRGFRWPRKALPWADEADVVSLRGTVGLKGKEKALTRQK